MEILGIIQARKWNVASLNEFRKFFNLKPYQKFEDLNPDPYVAKTLANLYGDVDNVEMYPGMFLEATKPAMSPGMGLCIFPRLSAFASQSWSLLTIKEIL